DPEEGVAQRLAGGGGRRCAERAPVRVAPVALVLGVESRGRTVTVPASVHNEMLAAHQRRQLAPIRKDIAGRLSVRYVEGEPGRALDAGCPQSRGHLGSG